MVQRGVGHVCCSVAFCALVLHFFGGLEGRAGCCRSMVILILVWGWEGGCALGYHSVGFRRFPDMS